MKTLIALEWKTWLRNRRLAISAFLFLFWGILSPVMVYYMKDILARVGGSAGAISFPDPTWQSLLASYYQNAAEIGLFVLAYFVADSFKIEKTSSLGLYYRTVAKNSRLLFVPKLIVTALVACFSSLIGGLASLYITWVFFEKADIGKILLALLLQTIAILVLSLLAACLSVWTRSVFLSVVLMIVLVFLGPMLQSFESIQNWLPSSLLAPTGILAGTQNALSPALAVCLLFGIMAVVLTLVKSLRIRY